MHLETKRLILRSPRAEDTADYMEFCNTEFVQRYNAMTPRTEERVRQAFSQPCEDVLLLQHKQSGKVIGEIDVNEDSLRYGVESREISYLIREDHSRRGYMKEALQALIEYLFTQEQVECVSARCFAPNEASLALLKSLGFCQDGYIPRCVKGYQGQIFDDTVHSLLRETFIGKHKG